MSGKAYTMKEMKSIVDYLIEHKSFAEIKGRKMWVDFANSKLTNRTWQSLKETFLKRILPDIHNPYYKLTKEQIICFREGCDVVAREKSRLEIIQVDDDSNSNAEKEIETEQPSTSHNNNGEATPGEEVNCAKIQSHDRASVDTVIITNCYETDDDLRRVLESGSSPTCENKEDPNKNPPSKSLRDLITYSEPLTPMLQEVLNDFASEDDSDGERMQLQIVENSSEADLINSEPVIEIFDSEDIIENNNATNNILLNNNSTKDNSKQNKAGEGILSEDKTTEATVKKETPTDDIVMMNTDAVDNAKKDTAVVDNVSKNTAAEEDNAMKDAVTEEDSNPNKALEDNLKTYKSKTKINIKRGQASEGNAKKDIAAGENTNQDKSKEQVTETNKVAKNISEKEKSATITTEAVMETNIATENLEKRSENDIEKDKTIEDSLKTAEESGQNGNSNAEEVVQPKVLLKLRKRKNSEKAEVKKPSSKHIKARSEMYEIVEPEILEKSTSNFAQVDNLSNYANNNDEIVSSTVSDKPTQNSSNSDTILPNNQEALNSPEKSASTVDRIRKEISKSPNIPDKVIKPKTTRKRAISQDVASTSKIKKSMLNVNGTEKAVSDTDDIVMKDLIKSKLTKSKLALKKKIASNEVENETTNANETKKVNETTKANETTGKTNAEDKIVSEDVPPTSQPIVIDSSQASELNPCLKSVSLFAEQFNTVSYIDSESEHETTPAASATDKKGDNKPSTSKTNEKKKEIATANVKDKSDDMSAKKFKSIANNVDEVVMLKSRSESESETKATSDKNKLPVSQEIVKSQRDKALANVFGFMSGGTKRKKRTSYRKNVVYHQHHRRERDQSSCDSSEWTSESDSETYVSPPRGRKNKQSRKYLKPHSARILSLEDEGGMFVMYGKKIYPLVKDGKIIKNYLTYLPESDPEEEESYWKLKYVEERKRVAELKKLMKENEEEIAREKSPILPARPMRLSTSHRQGSPFKNAPNKEITRENIVEAPEKETKEVANDTGKTLKITFARNNQEVHMEGHWSHIHPVLAEVVQIFNKDADAAPTPLAPVAAKRPSVANSDISVAAPSPVDKDTLEKVNKLETEIFKEIEERAQEEDVVQPKEQTETNVTQRKRASRVRKSTSTQRSSTHSPASSVRSAKRQKTSSDEPKDDPEEQEKPSKTKNRKDSNVDLKDVKSTEVTKNAVDAVDSTTKVATKRLTRTPKKDAKEAVNAKELNTRSKRSKAPAESKANSSQVDEDSDIRYMFPPTARTKRSTLNVSKSKDKSKRYMTNPSKIFSSLQLPTFHDESTQGYQDSDVSPPKASLRRKRKLSLSTVLYKTKNINNRAKRKSLPCIINGDSSDTSSAFQIIVRPTSNSSLKSEAYRSDSYQLLFPQNKNVFRPLEKIDEHSPVLGNRLHPKRFAGLEGFGKTLEVRVNRLNDDLLRNYSHGIVNTDGGNSSNVSLPLSPELSIVENLSISRELMNSVESNYPTINEMQANKKEEKQFHSQYLISQVDVSMPLMQQECGLHESIGKKNKTEPSFDHKMSIASDSLLNKIDTDTIEEAPSLSDSLDTRLRNLLLESAKKMSMPSIQEKVPNVKLPSMEQVQKKGKSKRCSTPRKKKDLTKPKLPIVDPVVEEEFMESCSYGGRKSCPPAITVISEEVVHKENLSNKDIVTEKSKGRRKKDVIKVKILRPRNRSSQSRSPEVTRNSSKTTVNTDSGINESGLTVQGFNDSVDLIHNHSETCLLANECMGNSVEFIETNTKSIISLNTNSTTSPERISREQFVFQDCQDFVPDFFSQNAQSFCNVDYVPDSVKLIPDNVSDTVYHSPMVSEVSNNSLITEDLSDETPQNSQPTNWYLLSEDDTSGTNVASQSTPNSIPSNFGANLKQIFPITCAVPNLSTITENSNDNSRKQTINSANSTRHDLDSQSMFDMNSN